MYPIGTERLRNRYVEVKVSHSEWRLKHHLIWEKAHGAVPDRHFICFVDGDNRNFCLDNLKAVSMEDHLHEKRLKSKQTRQANSSPSGSERIKQDGGFKYVWVKVGHPNTWRLKHHLIWEAAHGPVPHNHRVFFLDGDQNNFSLGNLQARLISSPPVGTERRVHSGQYSLIKVAEPNSWVLKHRLIWEAANGPVPDGHIIAFADGNYHNLALDNLVLLSYSERGYMAQSGLFKAAVETELFKTAVNVARLGLAVNKKRREIASQHI